MGNNDGSSVADVTLDGRCFFPLGSTRLILRALLCPRSATLDCLLEPVLVVRALCCAVRCGQEDRADAGILGGALELELELELTRSRGGGATV